MTIDDELDRIYELVDKLCWESKWEEINQLLIEANTEENLTLRLGWLTITACVKMKLPFRPIFYECTWMMLDEYTEERKQSIMMGLL